MLFLDRDLDLDLVRVLFLFLGRGVGNLCLHCSPEEKLDIFSFMVLLGFAGGCASHGLRVISLASNFWMALFTSFQKFHFVFVVKFICLYFNAYDSVMIRRISESLLEDRIEFTP